MVHLKLSDDAISRLQEVHLQFAVKQYDESVRPLSSVLQGDADTPQGVIEHEDLISISGILQREGKCDLDDLLAGAQVWTRPRPKFVRSAELESTLARIKQQQDEQAYREMIDKASPVPHTEAQEWLEVRRQISALVNIFFSAIGVATAIWWSLGKYAPLHIKLSLSFMGALAIVAIEAFLYSRHFTRMKEKREWKEMAKKGKLSFVPQTT